MDFKKLADKFPDNLKEFKDILIYIKGSPDPDAIASAFALKAICDHLKIKSAIVSGMHVSLPQNKAMIDELAIPVRFDKNPQKKNDHDAYAVLDFQSANIPGLSGEIPCALHIDHHEVVEENINIKFKIAMPEAGATSSIMALILKELGIDFENDNQKKISTALHLGIQADTDNFLHAGKLDVEALEYLAEHCDREVLSEIMEHPLPKKTLTLLRNAIKNHVVYKGWLLTGLGYVDESTRDSIAVISDFLLQKNDVNLAVVFALIEKHHPDGIMLNASLRASDEKLNLDAIIKKITQEGGARRFKGAYQINLDYFTLCPDKNQLWSVVYGTTIEALKKQRDRMRITEIKGVYKNLVNQIKKFFRISS